MKKQWMIGAILLCCFLLISCGNSAEENKKAEEAAVMQLWFSETEKGILFCGNTDKLYCYDPETGKTKIYCEKSGCKHDSEECPALKLAGETPLMTVYQDKLYYINEEQETGKEGLYCLNWDGEEKQIIGDLNGLEGKDTGPVFYGGKAFLFLSDAEVETDGTGGGKLKSGTLSLCSVDLETGEKDSIWTSESEGAQMPVWSAEHTSDQYLYYWFYLMDIKTGAVSESGWYELDMNTNETRKLELEGFARSVAWNGRKGIFCVDELEMPMEGQEKWENCYWLADLETGEKTKLEEYNRPGPGIWLKDGFLYLSWSSDMRMGTWKLYDWEAGKSSELFSFEPKEETMFYPEICIERGGKEMLIGRSAPEGVKGHYLISVEEFLAGNTTYELICKVDNGSENWAFRGSR